MLRKISLIPTLLILGILSGCSRSIPDLVRRPPPEDPSLRAVREDVHRHKGESVRWGGTIAGTQNFEDHTRVEIIARELGKGGQPRDMDVSPGRFLARIDEFLEPTVYRQGREITVYGTIKEVIEGQIGKHPYRFPVVHVDAYHLWELRERGRGPLFSPRFRFGFGFGFHSFRHHFLWY